MRSEIKLPKGKQRYQPEIKKTKIWRNPVFIVILFGVLILALRMKSPAKEILDMAEYHQDGISYRVTLEGKAETKYWKGAGFLAGKSLPEPFRLGKEIVIYEKPENSGRWEEKKRYDFEGVGPWCVAMAQMDEQEDIEIFFGAYRATDYFPEGPRPYFFTWDSKQQKLLRLWTGSYLDAPIFLDAEFEDFDGNGKWELKLQEIEWVGESEFHYQTYYTYLRKLFVPKKLHREVLREIKSNKN